MNIEAAENIVANGSDITFTYPSDGDYTWTLTYTDPSGGCVVNFDTTINVNVDLITADFTVDNALICDSEGTISLESNSIIEEDDNSTFTYSWTVGESSLEDLSSSTTHTISSPGTYNVGLTVTNTATSCSDSKLEEDFITVVGATEFIVNDFDDGNLCNDEVISLTNTSSHYSEQNAEDFQ